MSSWHSRSFQGNTRHLLWPEPLRSQGSNKRHEFVFWQTDMVGLMLDCRLSTQGVAPQLCESESLWRIIVPAAPIRPINGFSPQMTRALNYWGLCTVVHPHSGDAWSSLRGSEWEFKTESLVTNYKKLPRKFQCIGPQVFTRQLNALYSQRDSKKRRCLR